jgi:hypothetical protein
MPILVALAQVVIAVSVLFVWVVRLPNVEREFVEYGLPDVVRNLVGASKISAAALLLAGLQYPGLVFPAAVVMSGFMLAAQLFHAKVRHPWSKYAASFVLLLLSLFVAFSSRGVAA